MTRKKEREQAFCLVFEKQFRNDSCEDIISLAGEIRDFEITDYIKTSFSGVFDNINDINSLISENLRGWDISRLSKSCVSILQLSVYELKYNGSVPEGVTINEAVELAKKYCDEKEVPFLNGILGSIAGKLNTAC